MSWPAPARALNAYVTPDGGEIGWAQLWQARRLLAGEAGS